MPTALTKEFSGTGTSETITMQTSGLMDVSLLGSSWSGTVKLKRKTSDGTPVVVDEFTASAEKTVQGVPGVPYFFECTSYSSGSIVCEARTA